VVAGIVRVADDELARLAKQGGSRSVEARILRDLRRRRAKDYQAYAFRVGDHYFTGPIPDALTEHAILDLLAVVEWVQHG
jgi:hypothetical protein